MKGTSMEFIKIDMETYPRRAHFDYFRAMAYPYAGMTVNADVTRLMETVKDRKLPFFLTALYLAANAANAVPELRRRIRDGGIVEFPNCNTSHTVALPDGTYCYCMLDCSLPFGEFIPYAAAKQEKAGKEPCLDDGEEADSLFFFSSVPWVSYSSIIQPTPFPADSNPRITFGRYFAQDGKMLMPVTILVNHALADGKHMADFYRNLEPGSECMKKLLRKN